jgi:hypothetical protein
MKYLQVRLNASTSVRTYNSRERAGVGRILAIAVRHNLPNYVKEKAF